MSNLQAHPSLRSMAMASSNGEEKSTANNDPSLVYQSPDTAKAFVNVRQGIPLIQEQMNAMVQVIRYFLPQEQERLSSSSSSSSSDDRLCWLDLGCGNGPLGQRLATEFPASRGIFLDHSDAMLQEMEDLSSIIEGKDHVVIRSDFSSSEWLDDLSKAGGFKTTTNQVDVIVSGFAIPMSPISASKNCIEKFSNS